MKVPHAYGLVIGGLLGGPLAKRLIVRHQLAAQRSDREQQAQAVAAVPEDSQATAFEHPSSAPRLITADAAIETLALFAGCLAIAEFMTNITKDTAIQLPTFVWALGTGVVLRNTLDYIFGVKVFDRAIDVFGNAGHHQPVRSFAQGLPDRAAGGRLLHRHHQRLHDPGLYLLRALNP